MRERRYQTIVADPPWDYGGKEWVSYTHNGKGPRVRRPLPYATMELAAIVKLPVASIAADDCRLFLWTTNRHLPDALRVVEVWEFAYVQHIVWRKTGNPTPFSGGGIAPVQHELLLVAKRGSPQVLGKFPSSVVDAPAASTGQHSAKPECFLDYIEQVSPEPRLEMFARRSRMAGWDYWGDESLQTVDLEGAV